MDEANPAKAASLHDLRHHLALMACDLSLSLARLRSNEGEFRELYAALIERLDAGLALALAWLAGPGTAPAVPYSQDLSPLVEALWERFLRAGRLEPGSSRLEIVRPLLLAGDPQALHSLLLNLLANACEAAPAGPIHLALSGETITLDNGGRPLDPAIAALLAQGKAPRPAGGRGRGLAIILSCAARLGFALRVESPSGLTRWVLERHGPGAPRLLLVEDDPDLRGMLAELLRREGWRVDEASQADEALARAGPFRAAVADLHLPGLGGEGLLAQLKRGDPSIKTFLLTGESQAAARHWEGVDSVLIKPGLTELVARLSLLREGGP